MWTIYLVRVLPCEQDFRGGGAQSSCNMSSCRPSDLVRKSNVALFVQSSQPENNAVEVVGFDDHRVYPARRRLPFSKFLEKKSENNVKML